MFKTRLLVLFLSIFILQVVAPQLSWGFPEMVRHHYVNCISCHVSPSGGGVLTRYGRELSREVLSTWGKESLTESAFAYGLVKPPEWMNAMGFYRNVYAYQKTPFVQEGRFIFMQNDLEISANVGKFYFASSVGYQNRGNEINNWEHLISRRHFVNYRPTDEISIRAGRFFPAYGINTADHVIPIKRRLGWDESQESYNVEAAWLGEKTNLYLTANLGRPEQPSLAQETGFVVSPSITLQDSFKLGASYLYGNKTTTTRHLGGIWGILGFSPHLFLLSEWDVQLQSTRNSTASPQTGLVNYQKFDYEWTQGLHVYLTQDLSQLDLTRTQTLTHSYGLGIQFFPRPHLELNLSWQKIRMLALSDTYSDFAWAMLNFYL